MLNITPCSTACVKLRCYADYAPVASFILNLGDVFLKYAFRPCVGEARLQDNHYFAYLDTKTWLRFVTLILPVVCYARFDAKKWSRPVTWILPVILIAITDLFMAIKAEAIEALASQCGQNDSGNAIRLYYNASHYGSVEAHYVLGNYLWYKIGIKPTYPEKQRIAMIKHCWRDAAALGHPQAQEALKQHFSKQ